MLRNYTCQRTSPFAKAAASIYVPASIRSGITVCSVLYSPNTKLEALMRCIKLSEFLKVYMFAVNNNSFVFLNLPLLLNSLTHLLWHWYPANQEHFYLLPDNKVIASIRKTCIFAFIHFNFPN